MKLISLIVGLSASATLSFAEPRAYRFEWQGAKGYSMRGALAFKQGSAFNLVLAQDVSCFVIEGFFEGHSIGRWALSMLTPDTSWRLHFDTRAEAFVVDGQGIPMPQAWNMNGAGDDCGPGGFGFNIGNLGQDFCRNNLPLFDSRIAPPTPFPAQRDDDFAFPADACAGPKVLSNIPAATPAPRG